MALRLTSRGFAKGFAAVAGIGLSLWLLVPAQAQFWDWGRPQRYQRSDPFRDFFGGFPRSQPRERERDRGWSRDPDRQGPSDFSHAPGPGQKKPEAPIHIVFLGDANAGWRADRHQH